MFSYVIYNQIIKNTTLIQEKSAATNFIWESRSSVMAHLIPLFGVKNLKSVYFSKTKLFNWRDYIKIFYSSGNTFTPKKDISFIKTFPIPASQRTYDFSKLFFNS